VASLEIVLYSYHCCRERKRWHQEELARVEANSQEMMHRADAEWEERYLELCMTCS
jgi:hypothetical protein